MYSKNINSEIIESIDIVDLISQNIELTKKGNNFVGLCPFHSDNNPSFTVSPEKKIYKCFVCDAGGNVISFYQNFNKLSYNETIKQLGQKIGKDYNVSPQVKKTSTHSLLEEVMKFYTITLTVANEGKEALKYMEQRDYSKDDIAFYNIGYASQKLELGKYLSELGSERFNASDIDLSDLFNSNGSMFFSNRIIIPIMDDLSRVVGFSGRTLSNDSIKYLNSRDSNFFKKGDILYNLNNAKEYLQNGEIIIVEGFFDVFALRKIGINNVVAIMGTAFTPSHVNLFKKYKINKFVLCLDGDKPGIETSIKLGEILIKNGFKNIKCVNLQENYDIDESIAQDKEFRLENSITSYIEYKIKNLQPYFNLETIDGKTKYINKCLTGMSQDNIVFSKLVASSLSSITKLDMSDITDIINNKKLVDTIPAYIQPKTVNITSNITNNTIDIKTKIDTIDLSVIKPKYQVIIVYMMSSYEKFVEINEMINEQNIDTKCIDDIINKIASAYESLNKSKKSDFSLTNGKAITFEFFDFLSNREDYKRFNAILENNSNVDSSASELINGINIKIPGLQILLANK